MTDQKLRIAVLCGGRSAEHEVSISSAKYVLRLLDKEKYDIQLFSIDRDGMWFSYKDPFKLLNETHQKMADFKRDTVLPVKVSKSVDVVFPVLHGTYGEDGSIQGLLKLADVPYVGSSILSSAVCMDKEVSKRLLRDAGIPVSNFRAFRKIHRDQISYEKVSKALGNTMFVKPCNAGSSIGISKVKNEKEFRPALDYAFQYDNKIMIEEFIDGREFECAVIGNDVPEMSLPGEVISHHDFYDYQSKYVDDSAATFEIPAKLTIKEVESASRVVSKAYQTLCCQGMARVDYFIREGEVFINELNTLPGLTPLSLFPKLWAKSGVDEVKLLDRLVEFAIERYVREKALDVKFELAAPG